MSKNFGGNVTLSIFSSVFYGRAKKFLKYSNKGNCIELMYCKSSLRAIVIVIIRSVETA